MYVAVTNASVPISILCVASVYQSSDSSGRAV
jgi:hypothetical protein